MYLLGAEANPFKLVLQPLHYPQRCQPDDATTKVGRQESDSLPPHNNAVSTAQLHQQVHSPNAFGVQG